MKPKQLKSLLIMMVTNKLPILIVSPPGVGKTDIVKQVAAHLKMDLIISHPAVSSPIDYKGLPMPKGNGDADFIPIGDLRKLVTAKKPTIFFMDDIGQAPPAVQAALMQLFLSRQIGEHKVSDHVTFVAASNRLEDRAGVHQMLTPVKSRFVTIVTLESDVDEWVEWALQAGLPPVLIAFIMWKRNMLHDFQATAGFENSPCPRTVHNVAKLLHGGIPAGLEYEVIVGAIGKAFATEFCAFLQVHASLPNIEDCLRDPNSVTFDPHRPDIAYAVVTSAADAVKPNQMTNFVLLVGKFDKPVEVLGMLVLRERGPKFQETPAFVKWAQANADYLF